MGQTPYLEIPIVGVFGRDLVPSGVADALAYAASHEAIRHIVFTVDSTGGGLGAADEILALLKQHGTRFEYHAVVQRGVGAALWVVFACDSIHMLDGSSLGADMAVRPGEGGASAATAQANAAAATHLLALAEQHGHPAVLLRAMMLPEATVVAWRDPKGKVRLDPTLPAGVSPEAVLFDDGPLTVLTLTQKEAAAINLAQSFRGSPADLGAALKLVDWRLYNDYGAYAMHRAAVGAQGLGKVRALVLYIQSNISEAGAVDPQRYHDYGVLPTGQFTPTSKRLWAERTDAALQGWQRADTALGELRQLLQDSAHAGLGKTVAGFDLPATVERVRQEATRLRQNRSRAGPGT